MKKLIFSLAITALIALMPKAINAQTTEGFVGVLVLEHTDSIQILPGLYELWVHNKNKPNEMAFMYTLNDDLYTQTIKVKGKRKVELEGPPMDEAAIDRLQSEYRDKRNKELNPLQDDVDELMKVPDKEKRKGRKLRMLKLAVAKKVLAAKKAVLEEDFKKLSNRLKLRAKQGAFPVYNWQVNPA